jgi:serine/threonine protein kinase
MRMSCPACGARYERGEARCGVDGCALVPFVDRRMGAVLGGRYRVTTEIGAGGMGVVYGADDLRGGGGVAVKVLDEVWAGDRTVRERFLREMRAGMRLRHPHIVTVLDAGDGPAGTYLVMERLYGQSLSTRLLDGPMSELEALEVVRQCAEALAAVHPEGVVHRDIKPGNLFLVRGGRTVDVRVLDFGLALLVDEAPLTHAGFVLGTPRYMAPEQVRGRTCAGTADLYSLGVVLFEMLVGRPPFAGDEQQLMLQHAAVPPPRVIDLRPDVSPEVDALVAALLQKSPSARPDSALRVAAEAHRLGALVRSREAAAGQAAATKPDALASVDALTAWLAADRALVEARGELRVLLEAEGPWDAARAAAVRAQGARVCAATEALAVRTRELTGG